MNRTKTFLLATVLTYMGTTVSAMAHPQNKYAVGNMFTTALNLVETRRAQDASEPMTVSNIRLDHGQVIVVMQGNDGSITMVYDPIAHLVVADDTPGHELAMKDQRP